MKYYEKHNRSILKAIGYRMLIIFSSTIIVFIATRDLTLTFGASMAMTVVNTLIYYAYERLWNSIHWGKTRKK